jgi:hypothetical protein
MKKLFLVIGATLFLLASPASAGFNKTQEAFNMEINWAIGKAEGKNPGAADKLKVIKKSFSKLFDTMYGGDRATFYKETKKHFNNINAIMKKAGLPSVTIPNWL